MVEDKGKEKKVEEVEGEKWRVREKRKKRRCRRSL